jgi:hypothetical protein
VTLVQAKVTTVLVCAAVILAMLGVAWWHMETTRQQILENNALISARSYSDTFESLRAFYTKEVVSRVPRDSVTVSHDYKNIKHGIPLPATLTIQLAKEIGQRTDGFSVRLYSNYPFPWRGESGRLDGFEQRAIQKLSGAPGEPYYEFEQSQNGGYLRYATADIMQPDCVACHNSHPQSPKRDWKVGDLRGVLEVVVPMRVSMSTIMETFDYLLICFIVGGIIMLTTVIWVLGRR